MQSSWLDKMKKAYANITAVDENKRQCDYINIKIIFSLTN